MVGRCGRCEAAEGKAHSCRRASLTHVYYIIVATVLNVARPSLRELLSRSYIMFNTIIIDDEYGSP